VKSIVVYDSQFGNTEKIARAISSGLGLSGQARVISVKEIQPADLSDIQLLVVGSPTQGFTATAATRAWLKSLPGGSLQAIKAAAFDTRFTQEKINEVWILTFLVRIFGYGAKSIAELLRKKGAEVILPPQGFYVGDTEGPLLEKELERSAAWAGRIAAAVQG